MYSWENVSARDYLQLLQVTPDNMLRDYCGIYENTEIRFRELPDKIASVLLNANFQESVEYGSGRFHNGSQDVYMRLRSAPNGLISIVDDDGARLAHEYPTLLSVHVHSDGPHGNDIIPYLREMAEHVRMVVESSLEHRLSFAVPACVLKPHGDLDYVMLVRPE